MIRKIALSRGWMEDTDHECWFGPGFLIELVNIRLWMIGWGFDDEHPVRPWPTIWKLDSKIRENTHYTNVAFLGFFISWSSPL